MNCSHNAGHEITSAWNCHQRVSQPPTFTLEEMVQITFGDRMWGFPGGKSTLTIWEAYGLGNGE